MSHACRFSSMSLVHVSCHKSLGMRLVWYLDCYSTEVLADHMYSWKIKQQLAIGYVHMQQYIQVHVVVLPFLLAYFTIIRFMHAALVGTRLHSYKPSLVSRDHCMLIISFNVHKGECNATASGSSGKNDNTKKYDSRSWKTCYLTLP